MEPTSGYAQLGEDRIAYQVVGDGPVDIVLTTGWFSAVDVEWEDPGHRLFFQQMADFARVIRFDRRGSGASDPIPLDSLPPWEAFADEIEAVMDAVGSQEAAIVAAASAAPAGMLFSATRPERTKALILYQPTVRYLEDEGYPGLPVEMRDEYQAGIRESWGTGANADLLFPSRAGNERFRNYLGKLQRSISSPRAIIGYMEAEVDMDARSLLPAVQVPTLVIHRTESPLSPAPWGRYVADHIEGARLVELPGGDLAPYWDRPELTLDAIEEFILPLRREESADRQLATVLFTDIVGSTRKAEELGDRRWRAVLDLHDSLARERVETHSGHLIRSTGDGILATFEGPGRAIRGAIDLRDGLAQADLPIRTGIHAGEVELRAGGIDGLAVHLAARIMDSANA
jgi:pimeloyl-ACP methyl ester carboxylesterase